MMSYDESNLAIQKGYKIHFRNVGHILRNTQIKVPLNTSYILQLTIACIEREVSQ